MKGFHYCAFIVVAICIATVPLYAENKVSQITSSDLQKLYSKIELLEKRVEYLEEQISSKRNKPVIPCMEESLDTDDSFHGFGVAEEISQQKATMLAVSAAVEELTRRIFPSATNEDMQLVSQNSQIICRTIEMQETGYYKCYVAIAVSKGIIL